MTEPINLSQHYARPDLTQLRLQTEGFVHEVEAATSEAAFLDIVHRWNQQRSHLQTSEAICGLRYHQNTNDVSAKAENDFFDEAKPALAELSHRYAKTLLGSKFVASLDRQFGPQLSALKRCELVTFAPEIKDALAEEARLKTQYIELMSRTEIEFRGVSYNMAGLAQFFVTADRQTRLDAQRAREGFLAKYVEAIDSLYDRMVKLRHQMGRALGYENFIPLGYALMNRTEYGASEVAAFREEIRREVVPLAGVLARAQAKRLGVEKILFHDEGVFDTAGNPEPKGGVDFCIDAAQQMYRSLGPSFSEFFEVMRQRGLLDLDTRPGKAGGGFCTMFDELELPFVFANFNGSEHDVRVLTHECGHAFQAYQSRKQPFVEYKFPTYEAAEVHSMSMEFLTYPYMPLFFGEAEAQRFYQVHLETSLNFLPYAAAVDHFQHEVYQSPTLTPKERRALWREMEAMYLPERDYAGLFPHLETGAIWQRQQHIFGMPFYYIDYALALTCALQFWRKANQDRPQAIEDYLAICSPGGSLSFQQLVKVGKLRSPFEAGCLQDIAVLAARAVV